VNKRPRLFVINDPHSMRISAELAVEIGYNESVVLLQLEYLIGISTTEEHDGDIWTYQTLDELRTNHFPWWSNSTIYRILNSLKNQGLIKIGNYNKLGIDRTHWFALDVEGINKLKSIQIDDAIFQNEKWNRSKCKMQPVKMKNATSQNETTIPETPTETPAEIPPETSTEVTGEDEIPAPEVIAATVDSNLEAMAEFGILKNALTLELAGRAYMTPDYIRALGQDLKKRKNGDYQPGLLVSILDSGAEAPKLNKRGHLADCKCDECSRYRYTNRALYCGVCGDTTDFEFSMEDQIYYCSECSWSEGTTAAEAKEQTS